MTPEEKYISYLTSRQQRLTNARKAILDLLFNTHEHLRLDEILDKAGKMKISRATLFRTLNQMIDAKLIHKFFDEQGRVYYEHIYEHSLHHHLICVDCGNIIEIEEPELKELLKRICEKNNFIHYNHVVEVFGVCNKKKPGCK